jgi:hypothetical protein
MAKSDAAPVFLIAFVALLALLPNAWRYLDKAGWIPHREVIGTYVGQNGWTPGEYRDCIALPTSDGKLARVSSGILACDLEGHETEDLRTVVPHQLEMTFWGRVERHDMGVNDEELRRRNAICAEAPKNEQERTARRDLCDEEKHIGKIEWLWRCRRNSSSVTCWALN